MTDEDEESFTKVHIPLRDNPHTGGEAMWARVLGDSLYELRNVPFYAYGLNFGDVVRAEAPSEDQKPSVLHVVRAGGHRTLWLTFLDDKTSAERGQMLKELNPFKGYFEGADETYFAIDVEPDGDYASVRAQLSAWQALGILEFHEGETGGFSPRASPHEWS